MDGWITCACSHQFTLPDDAPNCNGILSTSPGTWPSSLGFSPAHTRAGVWKVTSTQTSLAPPPPSGGLPRLCVCVSHPITHTAAVPPRPSDRSTETASIAVAIASQRALQNRSRQACLPYVAFLECRAMAAGAAGSAVTHSRTAPGHAYRWAAGPARSKNKAGGKATLRVA